MKRTCRRTDRQEDDKKALWERPLYSRMLKRPDRGIRRNRFGVYFCSVTDNNNENT